MLSWVSTIRSRLYLAFGLAASMTVVGSLFALYASTNISTTIAEIVSRSMPATVESLRLAEEASTLVAAAPQLMAAEEESQRAEIALGITGQIQLLEGGLALAGSRRQRERRDRHGAYGYGRAAGGA